MLSFTSLPPEVRMTIYNILLQSTLSKTTRIYYLDEDPVDYGYFPSIRQSQSFSRVRKDVRDIRVRDSRRPEYDIHDIDDLLFLANTCRLLRAELLALAWSNADVRIQSPELYSDLRYIFCDLLSSESCGFIRTLNLVVDLKICMRSEIEKIVGLIRHQLPRLEQLIVYININLDRRPDDLSPSVRALGILPLHITVKLRCFPTRYLVSRCHRGRAPPNTSRPSMYVGWTETAYWSVNTALRVLQAELSLVGQERREKQAERESSDQVCDILEATTEMRSLMSG